MARLRLQIVPRCASGKWSVALVVLMPLLFLFDGRLLIFLAGEFAGPG